MLKMINMEMKELKAINGNEKKKIEKLNQSTTLPGSVRIKVETLKEEVPVEEEVKPVEEEVKPVEIVPQEEVLEIVTNEEMDEEETAEVALEIEGKTKDELAAMLEEIVQDPDVMKIKDDVTAIRVHFMKLNKEDMDKELEAFLDERHESHQRLLHVLARHVHARIHALRLALVVQADA